MSQKYPDTELQDAAAHAEDSPQAASSGKGTMQTILNAAYKLGYDNPAAVWSDATWLPVAAHAFRCGQRDAQDQQPRNADFRASDYDDLGERIPDEVKL